MTCIVGVVDSGKVYIGGDSAGVSGWHVDHRKDSKVFVKGSFIIGFSTSFRMGQLLRYVFEPPKLKDGQDVFEYIVVDFIEAVRECLKDGGFAKKESEQEEGGCFLVGFNGRLFEIGTDYQVGESLDECAAVGSGFEYALGSLHTTRGRNPMDRIEKALEASAHYATSVCGPFTIEVV